MGENDKLGFPIYFPSQPMCNDVGSAPQVWNESQMSSAESYAIEGSSDARFLMPPNCDVLKRVVDEMKEKILADLSIKPHKARKHYKPKFTL